MELPDLKGFIGTQQQVTVFIVLQKTMLRFREFFIAFSALKKQ